MFKDLLVKIRDAALAGDWFEVWSLTSDLSKMVADLAKLLLSGSPALAGTHDLAELEGLDPAFLSDVAVAVRGAKPRVYLAAADRQVNPDLIISLVLTIIDIIRQMREKKGK